MLKVEFLKEYEFKQNAEDNDAYWERVDFTPRQKAQIANSQFGEGWTEEEIEDMPMVINADLKEMECGIFFDDEYREIEPEDILRLMKLVNIASFEK
ncbi:hypothetical protein EUAN_19900 [Andreesenia angusta]|uniref:Uncharacterized protein n=1 Tax=Andreesenia angusta TaxID=39480 RepID=A0A1S1V5J4_9FIRM|nr:hypothetical protein [Andreesenia angusta]OHW61670.1 hypothetical protein EUAN_19900 [Andreesenia angusta]